MKAVIHPLNGICQARGYLNAQGSHSFANISKIVQTIMASHSESHGRDPTLIGRNAEETALVIV